MKTAAIAVLILVMALAVPPSTVLAHSGGDGGGKGGGGGGQSGGSEGGAGIQRRSNQGIVVKSEEPGLFGIKGLTRERMHEWSNQANSIINRGYNHMRQNPTVKSFKNDRLRALIELTILSEKGSKALEEHRKYGSITAEKDFIKRQIRIRMALQELSK